MFTELPNDEDNFSPLFVIFSFSLLERLLIQFNTFVVFILPMFAIFIVS